MSLCFPGMRRGFVSHDGLIHAFDSWMTDPDESHQVTECGLYLPDAVDEATGLSAHVMRKPWVLVADDAFATCLWCVSRARRRRQR